jgi:hypothetical protein
VTLCPKPAPFTSMRRNITKGQKAMAHAILFPKPEKGGRGKKAVATIGFSDSLLSRARIVLEHAPTLVEKVRDGFSGLRPRE